MMDTRDTREPPDITDARLAELLSETTSLSARAEKAQIGPFWPDIARALAELRRRRDEWHPKCETCGTELLACMLTRCPKCCPDLDEDDER